MNDLWRKTIGKSGEEIAADYLARKGYRIHALNIRNKIGELDLVAEYRGQIVIVEVKTKTGLGYGTPEEMVDWRKQRKLIRTAQLFLIDHNLTNRPWRIDVVAIRMLGGSPMIVHLENAIEEKL